MKPVSNTILQYLPYHFVPQIAEMSLLIDDNPQHNIAINEDMIVADTLRINYASSVGDEPRYGTVIAPELTFTLWNDNGAFDSIDFVGKEIHVYDIATVGVTTETYNMGAFIIDDAKRNGRNIVITALGVITKMDKVYRSGDIAFPITTWNFAKALVNGCGFYLKTYDIYDSVQNRDIVLTKEPEDGKYTYRQLLGYVCELMACNVHTRYINGHERVVIRWYGPVDVNFTNQNTFQVFYDKNPVLVGKAEVIGKNATGTRGSGDVVYTVKDNPLTDGMTQATLDLVAKGVLDNSQLIAPANMSATVLPIPFFEPMDAVRLKNENNQTICFLFISNYTWSPKLNTLVSGVGYKKNNKENYSPYTGEQETILDGIKEENSQNTDAIDALNEQVSKLSNDYVIATGESDGWTYRMWKNGTIEFRASNKEVIPHNGGSWISGLNYWYFDVTLPVTLADTNYSVFCTRASGRTFIVIGCAHTSETTFRMAVLIPESSTPTAMYANLLVVGTVDGGEPLADVGLADVAILTE